MKKADKSKGKQKLKASTTYVEAESSPQEEGRAAEEKRQSVSAGAVEPTADEIVKKICDKAFNESDFPSLKDSLRPDSEKEDVLVDIASAQREEKIVKHPFLGTITIQNQRTKARLTLFRVSPENSAQQILRIAN